MKNKFKGYYIVQAIFAIGILINLLLGNYSTSIIISIILFIICSAYVFYRIMDWLNQQIKTTSNWEGIKD